MLPDVPIEFLVHGVAVSLQASSASRAAWKERVRLAGRSAVPRDSWALSDRIAVTIYYFPDDRMEGDVDNIVKPILDGLSRSIYCDDRQVERVVVQKFERDNFFHFSNPSTVLLAAMETEGSVVYISVTDDPHGELL